MSKTTYIEVSDTVRIALEATPYAQIATVELKHGAGGWRRTGISGAGGGPHAAIQHLEQQVQIVAAAVSSTFAAEFSA